MEKEIYSLKERLENQQKYYHKEQQNLYENLSEKRRTIEQWKQTYFKSQVAVMSFRRKIKHVQQYLTFDQYQKLSQCLEVMDDAYVSKDDDVKYTVKSLSLNGGNEPLKKIANEETKSSNQGFFNGSVIPQRNELINVNWKAHPVNESEDASQEEQPTVFIMSEENAIIDPSIHEQAHVEDHKVTQEQPVQHINLNSSKDLLLRNVYPLLSHAQRKPFIASTTVTFHNTLGESSASMLKNNQQTFIQPADNRPSHFSDNDPKTFTARDFTPSTVYTNSVGASNGKFLELKFDSDLIKAQSNTSNVKPPTFTNYTKENFNKPETPNHRSHAVIAGTPLARQRIWCLKCDSDVTDGGCEHKTELVFQEREKEFPCPACGRIFNNRSHLKRHHMIHSGEKPWKCPHCEKRFNRKSHLNRHLLTHTGEKPFKCPVCQKGFADNSDLKRHRQTHEFTVVNSTSMIAVNKPITLSNPVTSSFTAPTNNAPITGHFSLKKVEQRFPCTVCGKHFTRKSHLTRHKLTHEQQKIYCNCGRMFRQQAHLNAHLPSCKRKRELIEAKYKADHPDEFRQEPSSLGVDGNPSMLPQQEEQPPVKQEDMEVEAENYTEENSLVFDDPVDDLPQHQEAASMAGETISELLQPVAPPSLPPLDPPEDEGSGALFVTSSSMHTLTPNNPPPVTSYINTPSVNEGYHRVTTDHVQSSPSDLNYDMSTLLPNLPPLIKDPVI